MYALTTAKAEKAIERYIEQVGFEIIERNWAFGNDSIAYIARDTDNRDLVFIERNILENEGNGIPEQEPNRRRFERLAIAYLCNADVEPTHVRLDIVSLLIVSDSRGMIRHHRNAINGCC